MKMKNDVSCLIDGNMTLFEHQSSWNPNMPIRGLMYFSELYHKYIDASPYSVYGTSLIKLPTPQYFILYNGDVKKMKDDPERMILRLSDAFDHPPKEGTFEWTATVININYGYNARILNACQTLKEYSVFIDKVNRKRADGSSVSEAVLTAVEECIEEKILFPFLSDHKAEVMDVCITEYNEKKHIEAERRDSFKEGQIEGRAEGKAAGKREGQIETIVSLRLDNILSIAQAASRLKMSENDYIQLETEYKNR